MLHVRVVGPAALTGRLADQLTATPGYPFWSLVIIALDVVALYGLCVYGSRANLAA